MAIRCDLGSLKPAKRMGDGRLRADAHITKVGIFEYRQPDGKIRREYRPPEEVFHSDSLASFAQVPVTNDHPSVGLLTSKNAKKYMMGSTGESVIRDDDHVRTTVMVADESTIAQMEAGKTQLSCGYTCDVDDEPGTHPIYGKYDAIQRNIRGNHLAIVDSARAGHTARVRMDGAAIMLASNLPGEDMAEDKDTVRALGAQLKTAEERADKAESEAKSEKLRADTNEGKMLTLESQVKDLTAKVAGNAIALETDAVKLEKARADAAELKVSRFDSIFKKAVRERATLERSASSVMGPEFRMDDLDDRQVRVAVVARLDASVDVGSSVDEGIIIGRFQTLVEGFNKNARSQARIADIINEGNSAETRNDSTANRASARDAWKQPLPNDIRSGKV